MKCPNCRASGSEVCDSRPTCDETTNRRRRRCAGCGGKFSTYEVAADDMAGVRTDRLGRVVPGSRTRGDEITEIYGQLSPADAALLLAFARRLSGQDNMAASDLEGWRRLGGASA